MYQINVPQQPTPSHSHSHTQGLLSICLFGCRPACLPARLSGCLLFLFYTYQLRVANTCMNVCLTARLVVFLFFLANLSLIKHFFLSSPKLLFYFFTAHTFALTSHTKDKCLVGFCFRRARPRNVRL